MSADPDSKSETKSVKKATGGGLSCKVRSPGPKYELKTLVGYREHCLSKYRNPQYTFGGRQPYVWAREGPGPKYLLPPPKRVGFTFGVLGKIYDTSCGPGPKYLLPSPKGPAFSLKSTLKPRKGPVSPGPCYNTRLPIPGPAFYIGQRLQPAKCDPVPGPNVYSEEYVKLRAPMYTLGYKAPGLEICRSPGPKYYPKAAKPHPVYSFGIKHGECAPPFIVECDDKC